MCVTAKLDFNGGAEVNKRRLPLATWVLFRAQLAECWAQLLRKARWEQEYAVQGLRRAKPPCDLGCECSSE